MNEHQLKEYNRYEVRLVVPHFSMQVVGIYQSLKEAIAAKERQHISNLQDERVIIYDIIKQERVAQ